MCICGFGENHYWIRCFLKQVVFFLKLISEKQMLYDTNHPQFTDDAAKQRVWMDIATEYRNQFVKSLLNFGIFCWFFRGI